MPWHTVSLRYSFKNDVLFIAFEQFEVLLKEFFFYWNSFQNHWILFLNFQLNYVSLFRYTILTHFWHWQYVAIGSNKYAIFLTTCTS